MGWFESQIKEREQADAARLEESLQAISDAITGKVRAGGADVAAQAQTAIAAVAGYYGASLDAGAAKKGAAGRGPAAAGEGEAPLAGADFSRFLEAALAPTGIMARPVRLTPGWQRDAVGAHLGFLEDDTPVALLPSAWGGYTALLPAGGGSVRVGSGSAPALKEEAYCFYRPLPRRALKLRDLAVFSLRALDRADYAAVIAATLAATLLGMLVPATTRIVFGPVLEVGDARILLPLMSLLVGTGVARVLLGSAKSLVMGRIGTKLDLPLQAAVMMRVLSLPASFFSDRETGDLANRVSAVGDVAKSIQDLLLGTTMTSVFSLLYVFQIANLTPALLVPALAVLVVSTAMSLVTVAVQRRVSRRALEAGSKLGGWQYSLLSGIQKIKLAGAESRAFAKWADGYQEIARLSYNGPVLLRLSSTIQTAISTVGTLLMYSTAIASGVGVAGYMAFTSAFGMVSGAFSTLAGAAAQIAQIGPQLEMARPVLDAEPESARGGQRVERLSGGFELDRVTFAYREGDKPVLEDLSLKVRPGSYVAVVGKTGCGKSTLMRLLLGFESPQRGVVYYDGRDLAGLDAQSVRRNIGVVLQDGKLFGGTIFENIAISAPGIGQEEAWRAAELAGIADDIRAMPMGMQTLVSEGGGGVSGGQRQRLMIARAVAGNPKILMFDEATSALDNVTQRIVSESLDGLKCTRLVIAHRLSTIKHCDRIVLIDGGRIAEDGTYDELIAKGGLFAELVARQQV